MPFATNMVSLALGAGSLCASPALASHVIYVNAAATGADDGTSWMDAYTDLQDALCETGEPDACTQASPCEIWVAAGVYKPDGGTGDRELSFDLRSNVALYGGFAGWERVLEQRDWVEHQTVLSGDLNGDDDPTFEPDSDCCTRSWETGCDNQECCEAVVALDMGCEIWWDSGCVALANELCCELCRGPTRCENSYHVLTAVETDSSAIVDGFTVTGGEANEKFLFLDGGGLYTRWSDPTVANCTFRRNAAVAGAGIYAAFGDPNVRGCTFIENFAYSSTGAALNAWAVGDPTVTNCAFIDNIGGGLDVSGTNPITGCDFIGNTALWGAGLRIGWGPAPVIKDCNFIENRATWGAGVESSGFPLLMINCRFIGNVATSRGGGMVMSNNAVLVNCLFTGNSAGQASPNGTNGALDVGSGSASLSNCTFAGNSAVRSPGGVGVSLSARIDNCIFWGNRSDAGMDQSAQLAFGGTDGTLSINNSIVQGWTGSYGGVGNSGDDPLFVQEGYRDDPGTPDDLSDDTWIDGDYRLQPDSPAINTGRPDAPYMRTYDLDGHARVLCDEVDRGAYEFGIGDYDCDQLVNLTDFAAWQACMTGPDGGPYNTGCEAFDFGANDTIDLTDFAGFQNALTAAR